MKRSGIKRGTKPLRADPAKVREWQNSRAKPIAQRSPKRIAEKPVRDDVVAATLERDGHRCCLSWRGGCRGPLIANEVLKRSAKAGAHLDARLTCTLCVFHNSWIETLPSEQQQDLGVMVPRRVFDRHGPRALDEARRIRGMCRPVVPFWRL